jgi:hypothetical protein
MIYGALDIFFLILHSGLIVFYLFGWIWKPTRKANLITLLLTGLSWVGLGIFFGIGYCPLTDWHWNILCKLGNPPQTPSYVAYLFQRILGVIIVNHTADLLSTYSYLVALTISFFVNIKDRVRKSNF